MIRFAIGLTTLIVGLLSPYAHADNTSLNLSRQSWYIYGSGVGTLSNLPVESIPNIVPSSISLRGSSSAGTNFGFAQALPDVPARFAKIVLRSNEPFILFFLVRASDGRDYYVTYMESRFRPGASGGIRYSFAPNFFNQGTQDIWETLLVDLESDLKVNYPGRSVVSVKQVAVRGQLDIGQLSLFSPADLSGLTLVAGAQSPNLSADDFDGDSRLNDLELSYGNLFRSDSDGDGSSDVVEAADTCGRDLMIEERTRFVGLNSDPDQDGVPSYTENYLGADCHVSDVFGLPQANGWSLYADAVNSVISVGQDGALIFTHNDPNPIKNGMLSLNWDSDFAIARERMSFSVKTTEAFVYYVRVKGTNGQLFYLTYQSGTGPSARSGEYILVNVGDLNPDISGYTKYSRNMSNDLAVFLPGVKVAKVLYVCVRGRLSLKDMKFLVPQIASVSQPVGNNVTLTGTTFGTTGTVTVDGVPVNIISWSDTSIEIQRPEGYTIGAHEFFVNSSGLRSNPGRLVLKPIIDSIDDLLVTGGDIIALSGSFGSVPGTVTINGAPAAAVWSPTSIVATVPNDAVPGVGAVVVTSNGMESLPFEITVDPNLVAITTSIVDGLQVFTFTGTNFGDAAQGGTLLVFGVQPIPADSGSWSNLSIALTVPSSDPGTFELNVGVNGRVSQGVAVTVKPLINSVAPSPVAVLENIVITGAYFGSTEGAVTVGGVDATVVTWTGTSIEAQLPANTPVGEVAVIVLQGGIASSAFAITVEEAAISSLTIDSINVAEATGGQAITLSGSFGPTEGSVSIGGVNAVITSWSPTTIVAVVPGTTNPGENTVVATAGLLSSPPVFFTVTPNLISLSAATIGVNDTLTLTGTNFGSVEGTVVVGGLYLVANSWSNTTVELQIDPLLLPEEHSIQILANGTLSNAESVSIKPTLTSIAPLHGSSNDLVTLVGGNFGWNPVLTVGGATVVIASQTPTEITFYPPAAGASALDGGAQNVVLNPGVGSPLSNMLSFMMDPVLFGAMQPSAKGNTTITLGGDYFGAVSGAVSIGGVSCTVLTWADDSITARVSGTVPPGSQYVQVTANGASSTSFFPLDILPSITPPESFFFRGANLDQVTITGLNFGSGSANAALDTLMLDGAPLLADSWSPTSIVFTIPEEMNFPYYGIYVRAGGFDTDGFTLILPPSIASITPNPVDTAHSITLQGQRFAEYQSGIAKIYLGLALVDGGFEYNPGNWTDLSIVTYLPYDTVPGVHELRVENWFGLSDPFALTVAPLIAEIRPVAGHVGDSVSLLGFGPSAINGASTVTFNGTTVAATFSAGKLTFAAPELPVGVYSVVVTTNGIASAAKTYEILPAAPVLVSVSPVEVRSGAPLTLTGTGFGAVKGFSRVELDGVGATVTSWSDTVVVVTVPTTLPVGYKEVRLYVGGSAAGPLTVSATDTPGAPGYPLSDIWITGQSGAITEMELTVDVANTDPGVLALFLNYGDGTGINNGSQMLRPAPGYTQGVSSYQATYSLSYSAAAPGSPIGRSPNGNWELYLDQGSPYQGFVNSFSVKLFTTANSGQRTSHPVIVLPALNSVSPSSVLQGGHVTLTGAGFGDFVPGGSDYQQVYIGGVAVEIVSWSATSIEAVVPEYMPGFYFAQVVLGGFGSNITSNMIEIEVAMPAIPLPVIDSRTPAFGDEGAQVVLTGTNFGSSMPGCTITVGGVPAGYTAWSDTNITFQVPATVPKGSQKIQVSTKDGLLSNLVPFVQKGSDVWVALDEEPTGRIGHSAIWTGREMILWGGTSPTGARYNPVTESWMSMSMLNAPELRWGQSAVWTGSEMLIWGGNSANEVLQSGARYRPELDAWSPMATLNAPVARTGHTATWTGSVMVVWGGQEWSFTDVLQTGGIYDPAGDSWVATNLTGAPVSRRSHSAVWTGSEVIVWGGQNASQTRLQSGGRLNPATNTWLATNVADEDAPTGRIHHTAVWAGDRMIIWGSENSNSGAFYFPTTDDWSPMPAVNAPGGGRSYAAVWSGTHLIVWGGPSKFVSAGAKFNLASNEWQPMTSLNSPQGFDYPTAVWTGSEFVVWSMNYDGRAIGARYHDGNDSWLSIDRGDVPADRERHTAVWSGSEMVVWGGAYEGSRFNPVTNAWLPISTLDEPALRHSHTAVMLGNEMIVWGGSGFNANQNIGGGRYNLATGVWTALPAGPVGRSEHTAVATATEMIVWGGQTCPVNEGCVYRGDGARFSPGTNAWVTIPESATLTSRFGHTAVWTGSKMIVWGGEDASRLNSGASYDPSDGSWQATDVSGEFLPQSRSGHTAVWTGTEMIVWGGHYQAEGGGRYRPDTNAWLYMNPAGEPLFRYAHTAVWTGSKMVVFGGQRFWYVESIAHQANLNTGGRFDPVLNVWTPTSTDASLTGGYYTSVGVWTGTEVLFSGIGNARYIP